MFKVLFFNCESDYNILHKLFEEIYKFIVSFVILEFILLY